MKVVLFKSVDNLGSAGEVVEVKRGYYRNFLGPRGLAKEATKANLATIESQRKKIEAMVARERAEAGQAADQLNGLELTFEMRSNDRGQLFGSVSTSDIATQLQDQGFDVDRRKIELSGPIKALGEHSIRIRLYPEVYAELTIKVERFLRPEERQAIEEEERRRQEIAKAAVEEAEAEGQDEEGAEAAAVEAEGAEEAPGAPEAAETPAAETPAAVAEAETEDEKEKGTD